MKCPECNEDMKDIHILSPYWPGYECPSCHHEHLISLSDKLEKQMKRKMGLSEDYAL